MDGHLGCLYILVIVNNVVINMRVHIFHQNLVFISFVYVHRDGIPGSYGRSIFNFSDIKRSLIGHLCRPSFRVGGPNQS